MDIRQALALKIGELELRNLEMGLALEALRTKSAPAEPDAAPPAPAAAPRPSRRARAK